MSAATATLELARQIECELELQGQPLLLIGALAMAAHGYPRSTEDIDFAVAISLRQLEVLWQELRSDGRRVSLSRADTDDPLGGVITIEAPNALPVQIVNFDNSPSGGFPALVIDALQRSSLSPEGLCGRLPTVEDLVLFKIYAGGPKSELDILELLTRCPVNLVQLRTLADGYLMRRDLDAVLGRVGL